MIHLNLTVGGSFTARVQAYTRSGYGPYSAPIPIVMDPTYPARAYSSTTNGEAWIIVLLAALVVMLACVIITVVYLKRKQNAGKQLGHFNGKYCNQIRASSYTADVQLYKISPHLIPIPGRIVLTCFESFITY